MYVNVNVHVYTKTTAQLGKYQLGELRVMTPPANQDAHVLSSTQIDELATKLESGLRSQGLETSVKSTAHHELLAVSVKNAFETKAVATWLSEQPSVHWVEPKGHLELSNRWAVGVVESNAFTNDVEPTPFLDNGVDGRTEVIGMADTGVDWDMCYFYDGRWWCVRTRRMIAVGVFFLRG
jgi:hypothetical protein